MTEKIPTHPISEEAQRNKDAHDATRIIIISMAVIAAVVSLIGINVCGSSGCNPANSSEKGSKIVKKPQLAPRINVERQNQLGIDPNLQKVIKQQLFQENYNLPYVPRKRDFPRDKKEPIML